MLKIVDNECVFSSDCGKGMVIVESDRGGPPFLDAFTELESKETIELAQQYAATRGCAPALLNGNRVGPYPVNSAGVPIDMVRGANNEPLAPQHPLMQPARYRVSVPVTRPIR